MNAPLIHHQSRRIRFGVENYLRLDETGVLNGVGRTELIDGDIIVMNAMHRPHSRVMFRLARTLEDALARTGSPLGVLIEATVAMPPDNAPQPDIVLTSEPEGRGVVPLPTVALLVEIAESSVASDLGAKAALYARMDIPEYWVVDIDAGRIVRMSRPSAGSYRERAEVTFGASLSAATVPGLTVATDQLASLSR